MYRRSLLTTVVAGSALSLSGCLGMGSSDESPEERDGTTDPDETADPDETEENVDEPLGHSASRWLGDAPQLGSSAAPATVIEFVDPSCPNCARFHADEFPLLADHIEDGDLQFHSRYYATDFLEPWAEDATQVLAAVQASDESAFWELLEYYFAEQDTFEDADVFAETRPVLSDHGLDAEAILEDARAQAYDDLVSKNADAAAAAGVETVPYFYMFDGTDLVTENGGVTGYNTFRHALGL